MQNDFKLSVLIITYNHEKQISETIDSILMQKTSFPIEIVIGEDCSSDNTARILKEYKKKFPELLKARFNDQNMGMVPNIIRTLYECSGKYIAICEGDDYWTDPYKLQKQVDFLEANPDFAICFHDVDIWDEAIQSLRKDDITWPVQEVTTINDLARGNYIHTPSVVFRANPDVLRDFENIDSPVGDYVLHMLNAKYGKIKRIEQVMAVYRIHQTNSWAQKGPDYMIPRWNIVLNALIGRFDHQVNAILVEQQINKYKNLVTLCKNEGKQIPDNFTFSNESLISLIEEREELKKQYKELKAEYSDIVSSRLYKLFNSVRPFLKRISRFK